MRNFDFKRIAYEVTACVREAEGRLQQVAPKYFEQLHADWARLEAAHKTDPDGRCSRQYVAGLQAYIDKQARDRAETPAAPNEMKFRLDLHDAEACSFNDSMVFPLVSCVVHASSKMSRYAW